MIKGDELVRKIIRIQRTIETFNGEWFSLKKMVELTRIPEATLHRLLAVFVDEHILDKRRYDEKGWYKPGYKKVTTLTFVEKQSVEKQDENT